MIRLKLYFFILIILCCSTSLFSQRYVRLFRDLDYYFMGVYSSGDFIVQTLLLPSVSVNNDEYNNIDLLVQNHLLLINSFLYHLKIDQKLNETNSIHAQMNQRRIEDYRETMLSFGYGRQLNKKLNVGIKANYINISKPEFVGIPFYTLGMDIFIQFHKKWSLLTDVLYAINQQGFLREKPANKFLVNINYNHRNSLIFLTLLKYQGSRFSPQVGFEHHFSKMIFLKVGMHIEKPLAFIDMKINVKDKILLGLSVFWNAPLGINNSASMTYLYK